MFLALAALIFGINDSSRAAPPNGFIVEAIGHDWEEVAGVTFLEDGRAIAWERKGRVWMIDANGTKGSSPMLDLSEEVGAFTDHGMLGFAADPNFLVNGRIYLLYVVDRHHLLFAGTPQYDPAASLLNEATIGRLTRYTATAASNFTQVDPASRTILLGESIITGIPILDLSHGVGSLIFGEDGTLLVSVGDNASFWEIDEGGPTSFGFIAQALADGIMRTKEDVGAYRAQLIDCLCGKILRLDPETGDGVSSNPYFDPRSPRAPRSRVWCMGLRNPFRMEIIPETGSHFPSAGDPGTLIIGDVGWGDREELNIAEHAGLNFGWPLFEGLGWTPYYSTSWKHVANADAPNPLFGAANAPCTHEDFSFRDLLIDDTPQASPLFVNPCGLFQAEDATLSGATPTSAHPGFTGTGAVALQTSSTDFVEWTVPVIETGEATIHIRYALQSSASSLLRITVDGVEVAPSLDLPPTGRWDHWQWVKLDLPLAAGIRVVRANAIGFSEPLLDSIAVTPTGQAPKAVPPSIPRFIHHRPALGWQHFEASAHVPGFKGALPVANLIGTPESGVDGEPFQGSCGIGGTRVEEGPWPEEWHGNLLFGDYASQFIRGVHLDANGAVAEVNLFDPLAGPVVLVRYNPFDHALWVVRWGNEVVRIEYAPDTNQAPIIVAIATPDFGPSPLLTTLDATASSDPEGGPLEFTWSFRDGSAPLKGPIVQHTFTGSGPQRHEVILTVRDAGGVERSAIVPVWTDNTPPEVEITSVHDGDLYSMEGSTMLPLVATIMDAEQTEVACSWITTLHHNTHMHSEPSDPACTTTTLIEPLGCGAETYFYSIMLTVTDPLGMATSAALSIFPDCDGVLVCPADLNDDGIVDGGDLAMILGSWNARGEGLAADLNHDHVVDGADFAIVLGAWGPC